MTAALRTTLSYLLVFLAMELPAKYGLNRAAAAAVLLAAVAIVVLLMPLLTLSNALWHDQAWWAPIGLILAVFLVVLLGHLELGLHWSARWLIAVAFAAFVVIVSHALEHPKAS